MTDCDVRPGEIYWVEIPANHTIGSEQFKRRPWLIVSRLALNRKSNIVVGVPLSTSKVENPIHPPHRILIPPTEIDRDISFTGEIKLSLALTDQVRAIDKRRLENKMGQVSATALAAVGLGLAYLFDLR